MALKNLVPIGILVLLLYGALLTLLILDSGSSAPPPPPPPPVTSDDGGNALPVFELVLAAILGSGGLVGFLRLRHEIREAREKSALDAKKLESEIRDAAETSEREGNKLALEFKTATQLQERRRSADIFDTFVREAESADQRGDMPASDIIRLDYEKTLRERREALISMEFIKDEVPPGKV